MFLETITSKEGYPKSCTVINLLVPTSPFPIGFELTHAEQPSIPKKVQTTWGDQEIQNGV